MNLGRENEQTEFKKSTGELREGMESIASILNKHGRGTLYFGVRDDGEVVGQDVSASTLRKISQAMCDSITPAIYPEIRILEDVDGRSYIRIDFEGTDTPYSCNGRYRIRLADADVAMSHEEVQRQMLYSQARRTPWDQWDSERPIDDVDENELRAFVERGNDCGRIEYPFTTTEDVLKRLGLMRNGKLTNAAEVLFCPSLLPQLSMGILATHARTEILDLHHECGTLFQLVRKAEHYILVNTRRRFVIDGKGPREEIPELPREAVREVLFNAFAHRDWLSPGRVQIDIYHDSVEITNPGWFIGGQCPDDHLSGADNSSLSRNMLIVSTLHKSKDIEAYGTGIPRIAYACANESIPIEYVRAADSTRFVFHRIEAFDDSASESARKTEECAESGAQTRESARKAGKCAESGAQTRESARKMTRTDEAILNALENAQELGTQELAVRTNLSKRGVQKALRKLIDEGVVERIGASRSTRYKRAK